MTKPWNTVYQTATYVLLAEKLFSPEEQDAVVELLAREPECGKVISGTGGVRKVRVALEGRGKSGGARVVYFFRNATMPLFLLTVFAKNEKDNLSKAERNTLAALVKALVAKYGGT